MIRLLILLGTLLIISGVVLFWFNRDKFSNKLAPKLAPKRPRVTDGYKGLCLFDIDGTLTTGRDNERVVQYCLDRGYAVGIATAGGIYRPSNLMSYPWMPRNLYEFMARNNFNTFNNVASGILLGRHDKDAYNDTLRYKPPHVFWPGWFKGLALERTGKLYGIDDPSQLILFDNDPSFLKGVKHYNGNLTGVCAGMPCNGVLTLDTVKQILK